MVQRYSIVCDTCHRAFWTFATDNGVCMMCYFARVYPNPDREMADFKANATRLNRSKT